MLWLKLYADSIKARGFPFLNLINFIVNTLKITQTDQRLHSNNLMIIYIDGLRQFSRVLFDFSVDGCPFLCFRGSKYLSNNFPDKRLQDIIVTHLTISGHIL